MMRPILGFLAGLLFGIGLVVSGMSDPAKVLNFLDLGAIGATWDPSLAFVMGGASLTAMLGYRLVWYWPAPVAAPDWDLPRATAIDRPLLTGAAFFGVGWGIGGFCPGPALTALPLLAPGTLVFLVALVPGLWLGGRAKSLPPLRGAPA